MYFNYCMTAVTIRISASLPKDVLGKLIGMALSRLGIRAFSPYGWCVLLRQEQNWVEKIKRLCSVSKFESS